MPADLARLRQCIASFDLRRLFVEELGWDHHSARPVDVALSGATYTVRALVEKKGLVVFQCDPSLEGGVPDSTARRAIDKRARQEAHEHLIVYGDAAQTTQIWQWVRREPGRPLACREYTFHRGQSGEALAQRLQALYFDLTEEETATVLDTAAKVSRAFDVDRVTRRFYDRFKEEHGAFLGFVRGIEGVADREWYASLTLNRLMFVYFIQKKGFLDGDVDYLRNRLRAIQARQQQDQFLTFYRHFLLRLFHEGLGQSGSTPELDALLGRVPYLNGGLFDVHQLERSYPGIEIPDAAFARLFDFFDAYTWNLDDRPLRKDDEINPDVLGYIFEKYVNQKQMGAYYTREDITEYIAKNTVIPYLFDAARRDCKIAFEPASALWRLLQDDPDRYVYEPVRKGVDVPLPEAVAAGLTEVSRRDGWNRPAAAAFALPTETWREHVARRQRCEEVRAKLRDGQVHEIDGLITYNLDIRQLAQDAIESCEGPELLRAFYHAIESVSVLDPTCGSGAFLFAALNVLEPLYEACLERMQGFLDDLDRSGAKHRPEKFSDFRKVLDRVAAHPNRRYFILKSIVVDNLYGVDIMEEAVEICKLRLFLKLAAQIERVDDLEPLPDVDFNVRAGNTLVGFASIEDVKQALSIAPGGQGKLLFGEDAAALKKIEERAEIADRAFQQFHRMQTERDAKAGAFASAKADLRRHLGDLADELDRLLAGQYGVDPSALAFETWRKSHQPFHWFAEFYGIVRRGGFDVIVGNPPWIEYSSVRRVYSVRGYKCESCGNLLALCSERALSLRSPDGSFSFIVQLPIVSSPRMAPLRDLLRDRSSLLALIPCDDRPARLFDGLEHCRSVIVLSRGRRAGRELRLTAPYLRWATVYREFLFNTVAFVEVCADPNYPDVFAKYGSPLHRAVLSRVAGIPGQPAGSMRAPSRTEHFVFYQESVQYWTKAVAGLPYFERNGAVSAPRHGRYFYCPDGGTAQLVAAVLNSSLFYSYFVAYGDCFHLNDSTVQNFRLAAGTLRDPELAKLGTKLMADLRANAHRSTIRTSDGYTIGYDAFAVSRSKPIIDEIDRVLARHYGFTDEELDFIINYDIKYRMGHDRSDDD